MFNQNVTVRQAHWAYEKQNRYTFVITDQELDRIYEKHKGEFNVKVGPPISKGSDEQNRAAHALMSAYWLTGMFSYPAKSLPELKVYLKLAYGPTWNMAYEGHDIRVPKSWADFSKDERSAFIEGLLAEIHATGAYAASRKLQEIIAGFVEA